jgi:hypothetical protein
MYCSWAILYNASSRDKEGYLMHCSSPQCFFNPVVIFGHSLMVAVYTVLVAGSTDDDSSTSMVLY